jgi:hypothetical protein
VPRIEARFPEYDVVATPGTTRPVDPLLAEVLRVLARLGPAWDPRLQLHSRLPDWAQLTCPTARDLGVALAGRPAWLSGFAVALVASGRLHSTAGKPSVHCRSTRFRLSVDPRWTTG